MKFWSIQLLRFIAAVFVVLFHLYLIKSGHKGVDVFFVISGYVMYLKLFIFKRPRAFVFFVNRFTKIFFLYWLVLLLLYWIRPFPLNADLYGYIFLIPEQKLALPESWTLSYELYFYFLVGAIAYLLPERFCKPILLLLLLLSSCITLLDLHFKLHVPWTSFLFGKYTWEFLLGILCADLSYRFRVRTKKMVLTISIAFVFFLLSIIYIPVAIRSITGMLYGTLTFLLLFLLIEYEKQFPVPDKITEIIKKLGDASYAIYLIGPLVILLNHADNIMAKLVNITITLFLGIFVSSVVEKHSLPWIRKKIYGYSAAWAAKIKSKAAAE